MSTRPSSSAAEASSPAAARIDDTPEPAPPAARPLTDSPWFWIYLFATFGLAAIFWMGPKYAERQSQLDRQWQGRRFAAEQGPDATPRDAYSVPEEKLHDLRWLGYPLAVVLCVAWGRLLWQRARARRELVPLDSRDSL